MMASQLNTLGFMKWFASSTAHITAMYAPFLAVAVAAQVPPYLAVLTLAFFSALNAGITHYGTGPAPIYFNAGYMDQKTHSFHFLR